MLVVKGDTLTFNPTIDAAEIEQSVADDPEAARAEWFSEFRSDLSALLRLETIMACVEPGVAERQPDRQFTYTGFVDVAGGSGTDNRSIQKLWLRSFARC